MKNHFKYINQFCLCLIKDKLTQLDMLSSNFHVNNKVQKMQLAIIWWISPA